MSENTNLAILWDVENVTPKYDSLFITGLLDFCEQLGKPVLSSAYGDWSKNGIRKLGDVLAENAFELIHIPKSKKNSADVSLITHAIEMIFQYPHINRYVILTGDIDFRPLLLALRKHGKEIYIVCDSKTASEDLLALADDYKDYRNLIPDHETEAYHENGSNQKNTINRQAAFKLLVEAIKRMEAEDKIPTSGSVKVKMKLLNESFDENKFGYKRWKDFINDAMAKNYIVMLEEEKWIRLTLPNSINREISEEDIPPLFHKLIKALKQLSPRKKWIYFSQVSKRLMENNVNIKEVGYSKLKEFILDAEKRGLVETKNDKLKWFVKLA